MMASVTLLLWSLIVVGTIFSAPGASGEEIVLDVPRIDERDHIERTVPLNFTLIGDVYFTSFWKNDNNYVQHVYEDVDQYHCPQLSAYMMDKFSSHINCTVLAIRVINTLTELRASWTGALGLQYQQSVERAIASNVSFDTFKSDEAYISIVEGWNSLYPNFPQQAHGIPGLSVVSDHGLMVDSRILLRLLQQNDRIGNPPSMFELPLPAILGQTPEEARSSHGLAPFLSSLTLRYLKVNFDLDLFFNIFGRYGWGSGDGGLTGTIFSGTVQEPALRIAEIGCGYGGQSQALFALNEAIVRPATTGSTAGSGTIKPKFSYHYFDLDPVLALIQRYMGHFPWIDQDSLHMHLMAEVSAAASSSGDAEALNNAIGADGYRYDLCISNYAVSELSLEAQYAYISAVLRHCRAGYVTYNIVGEVIHHTKQFETFRMRLEEALSATAAARVRDMTVDASGNDGFNQSPGPIVLAVVPEIPSTHDENRILVWGNVSSVLFR